MRKLSKWLSFVLILCLLGSMMPFALADGAETEPAEEAAAAEEAAPAEDTAPAEEAAEAVEEAYRAQGTQALVIIPPESVKK